jgi:hypothetical protein
MAYTQQDLDEIKEMIAAAVLEEQHGDKRTKFAPIEDLRVRLRLIERELNGTANRRPNAGVIVFPR